MAANKFASKLHKNTNQFTLILIYAMLEGILILLLLFNSLFQYLIIKFANYFGLKKPCFLCCRIDHMLEPKTNMNSYNDLVCELHSAEISKLGFCLNHKKLGESQHICEDRTEFFEKNENGDVGLKCKFFSHYFVIKPSWEILDYTHKGNSVLEKRVGDEIIEEHHLDQSGSDYSNDEQRIEKNRGVHVVSEKKEEMDLVISFDDSFQEVPPQPYEFGIDRNDYEFIPIKLSDLITMENESQDFVLDFDFLVEKQDEKSMEFGEIEIYPGCGEAEVLTIEKLKLELRNERESLNALCEELEEERNASAVAANEAIAMINRLQEEKAAMQMEALQYQRMMDEQSEYDQQALHLLNEIIVRRERQHQEMEKELDMYRKRVRDFEAKERNGEDGDEVLFDGVWLEDERMLILEQLRVLEEKLFRLSDEDDEYFENEKPIKSLHGNGHKTCGIDEGLDGNGHKTCGFDEGLDYVYERLEALEADRDFLRHCVNSLRKGDKGVYLLQEILQHLQDLRGLDYRARNLEK